MSKSYEEKMETIDLTDYAKEIFGEEIVKYAYVTQPYAEGHLYYDTVFNSETLQPHDSFPVAVEFNNGKKFSIWTSEWGGVTVIK